MGLTVGADADADDTRRRLLRAAADLLLSIVTLADGWQVFRSVEHLYAGDAAGTPERAARRREVVVVVASVAAAPRFNGWLVLEEESDAAAADPAAAVKQNFATLQRLA